MPDSEPSLTELGSVYLRIANLTFGGGNPTVAALQRELVENRGWIDGRQFALSYALARITPGTNLFAFCIATGWIMQRVRGALIALFASSVPACVLVALITGGFDAESARPSVQVAIAGALAASVGILLASFWLLVRPYLKRGQLFQSFAIVGGSIALSLFAHLSPLLILGLAGVTGFFWKGKAEV